MSRFPGQSVLPEFLGNEFRCRLGDFVFGIGGKFRADDSSNRPARPGAPAALFAPRFVHAIGEVLEMYPGIPDKNVRRGVP